MAKTIKAYTSERGDGIYKKKSEALFADLRNLLIEITISITGDINQTCDRFRFTKQAFDSLLDTGLSPRSVQRKFLRLYNLKKQYEQQLLEEKQMQDEDIPLLSVHAAD